MDKIIQIEYQGRSLSIEESAYQVFQQYETELQNFFANEDAGDEIFADLQHRMGEILEQKNSLGTLYVDDIEALIATIGRPADFAADAEPQAVPGTKNKRAGKQLFRNKKDKVIAGVCSGIANYFDIDPIAVRLIFALFTIFNIATFMQFPAGLVIYVVMWIILKPAVLEPNITRKLFRNPNDKVLGGVCSGIAQFFNTEAWVIRLIFLAPILLGFMSIHSNFSRVNIEIVGHSLYSVSIISYMILWFIIPLAKVTTDYMLLKGEPINLSTIQNTTTMQEMSTKNQSGLSKFLKIIAYIIIGMMILVMVPTAIGILLASLYSYQLAEIVLFTTANKVMAVLTITLFIGLPLIGLIIWLIRRIMGLKPSKPLRITFIGLHTLGWISVILLAVTLAKQNNTYTSTKQIIQIPSSVDTMRIESTDTSNTFNETVFFEINGVNYLLEKTADSNYVKAVMLQYEATNDTAFSIEIEKSAFGENRGFAYKHATDAVFNYATDSNILKLPASISVSNTEPYYMQHVCVTVRVPRGKTIITAKKLKRQISKSFHNGHGGIHIEYNDEDLDEDFIYTNEVPTYSKQDRKEEIEQAKDRLKEIEEQNLEMIKEKERELDEAKKKLKEDIRDAKKEVEELKKEK